MLQVKRIFFFIATLLCTLTAAAQGKLYLGYCDGELATTTSGKYVSFGDAGNTVSIAIRLTNAQLKAQKGNKIVGVNYGLPVAGMLNRIDVWVRNTYNGENIASGSIKNPKYGWNEGALTETYTITGEEDALWIGATYTQSRRENAVSFAGTTNSDGCYVKNGDNAWTSLSNEGYGSLSLEAIIEGEGVITRDLQLLDVKSSQSSVLIGSDYTVYGTIRNNASKTAEKPVIKYSINGQHVGTYTCEENVAFRTQKSFTISIPTGTVEDVGTAQISLSLEWADGVADEAPADNVANLSVEMTRRVFDRRMVVEEHTGSWCGWCVRGIVALKEMKEKYGDNFIGIAIHNGDLYSQTADAVAYDNFIGNYMSGYPNSVINRVSGAVDPSYTNLARHYQNMEKVADADINVDASYADGKITMNSHSEFTYSQSNTDFRVAFVVLENKLPIAQTNYYSGTGTVMGGFENMGSPAKVDIDDVARGIYPDPLGYKGAIPTNISEGTIYDYTYTTTMPTFKDGGNVEIVALLINGKTGEIINANKTSKIEGLSAGSTPVDPNDPTNKVTQTLSPASGTTVETLDKVIVTFSGKSAELGMNHAGYYNYLAENYGASPISISSRPYLRDDYGKTVCKAARVMWTYNADYPKKSAQPYNNNEFELDFDGVPAGHYTLVVPKNFFVYYDERDNLLTTDEFTAEYTVTKSTEPTKGLYNVRFSPNGSLGNELKTINLYSSSDIYAYYCDDLALYYNYFYVEEPTRPYVILPDGSIRDAKTIDYVEVTGGTATEQQIQFNFVPSYTEGCYTLVIPDDYIVVGRPAGTLGGEDNFEAYAARERRFNFYIGEAPEGLNPVAAPSDELPAYDIWGRMMQNHDRGITISRGKKILK